MIGCEHFKLRNKSHVNISFLALEVKWCVIYTEHFFCIENRRKVDMIEYPTWWKATSMIFTNGSSVNQLLFGTTEKKFQPNLSFRTPCKHEQIKCADQWIKLPSILLTSSVIFNLTQQQVIDNNYFFLTMEMKVISHSFLLKPFS